MEQHKSFSVVVEKVGFDFKEFVYLEYWGIKTKRAITVRAMILFLAVCIFSGPKSLEYWPQWLLFAGCQAFIMFTWSFVVLKKNYTLMEKTLPKRITFSDSGIDSKTEFIDIHLDWNYIKMWEKTRGVFFIGLQSGNAFMIPINAFSDKEDVRYLCNMLAANVPL